MPPLVELQVQYIKSNPNLGRLLIKLKNEKSLNASASGATGTVHYSTVHCSGLYDTVQNSKVGTQFRIVQAVHHRMYSVVQYSTEQYSTLQYTVQDCTVRYSTITDVYTI